MAVNDSTTARAMAVILGYVLSTLAVVIRATAVHLSLSNLFMTPSAFVLAA